MSSAHGRLAKVGLLLCLVAWSGCSSAGLTPGGAAPSDVDSTGTLWLTIEVEGGPVSGMQPQARVSVGVWERATRGAAISAEVQAGPVGAMQPLAEDPVNPGMFQGSRDLFEADGSYPRVWEFAVERGPDHVRHLVLLAPSYPSVLWSNDADGLHVRWLPAHEAGVHAAVLVRQSTPAPPPAPPYQAGPAPLSWSADSPSDDGTAGPFAIPPLRAGDSYEIALGRAHNYELDWGNASLSISGEAWLYGP